MIRFGIVSAVSLVGFMASCSSSSSTPAPTTAADTGVASDAAVSTPDGAVAPTDGDLCGVSDKAKATSVTKATPSDPSCPDLTVAQLNEPDDSGDSCSPVVDTKACKITIDCTDPDGTKTTGTFTASGGVASGTLSVVIKADGGAVTCSYAITFK